MKYTFMFDNIQRNYIKHRLCKQINKVKSTKNKTTKETSFWIPFPFHKDCFIIFSFFIDR